MEKKNQIILSILSTRYQNINWWFFSFQ